MQLKFSFFLLILIHKNVQGEDQCKRMMFKKRLTGKALTKFVFKRIQATENFCRALCYMNTDRCLSVNYGDEICELNESDHVIHPENLVTKQGYVYYAAENTCKCSKTELCRYNFASNTFKCLCNANDPAADCKASTNSPQSSVASPSSKSRTRTSKSVKTDTTSSSPNTTRAPPPHKTTSSPSIKSNPTSSTSPPKTTGHGSTSAASPPTSETSFSSKSSPTTTKLTPNTSGGHDPSSTTSTSSTSATSSASVSASPSSTPSATTTTDSSTSTGSTQIKILMTTTSAPETKSSLQTSTTSSLSTPTEASKSLDIEVVSGSSTMPFKVMNTEYERELAGFNFLVLNLNGTPYESGNNPVRGFDTKHDNPSGAVDLLKKYVKNIPIGKIVLMAIQKSDHMPDRSEFLGVLPILPSIGSKVITFAALDGKKGWSLIGYKKAYIQSWPSSPSSPSWVEENISEKDNDLLAKTISPGSP